MRRAFPLVVAAVAVVATSAAADSPRTAISHPPAQAIRGLGGRPSPASGYGRLPVRSGMGLILNGVSCPSVRLCVVVDLYGDVLTSTNPAGGAPAWKLAIVDAG
jgi:hypothetical protein